MAFRLAGAGMKVAVVGRDPRRRVSERVTAYALYIGPPLNRVGMSFAEARNSGRRVLAGERPMTRVARAVEKGETQGFMRILSNGGQWGPRIGMQKGPLFGIGSGLFR